MRQLEFIQIQIYCVGNCRSIYIYIYVCVYKGLDLHRYMSGGQNYLYFRVLPCCEGLYFCAVKGMAKEGAVKVCTSVLCVKIGYRQVGDTL